MPAPLLSIIITTFNDGPVIAQAIESVLRQSLQDFQLIVVDDGSTDDTPDIVRRFEDERILCIQQFNDGLSSARNKGLEQVKGEYVCFLDADDIRPTWSFKAIAEAIALEQPDVIFCAGVLSEVRNELPPFYDHAIFGLIAQRFGAGTIRLSQDHPLFRELPPLLFGIEPQSANKVVRTAFLRKNRLGFPNTHFFEDMLFHSTCIAHGQSFGIVQHPCFTYFRRYLKHQITAHATDIRLDAVAVARMTLDLFARSSLFHEPAARTAQLLSVAKLLRWCEQSISHHHRSGYRALMRALVAEAPPMFFNFDRGTLESTQDAHRLVEYINGYKAEA